ncbi:MAG: signal peptide peptidase SppA [Planctomycetota bacterium]
MTQPEQPSSPDPTPAGQPSSVATTASPAAATGPTVPAQIVIKQSGAGRFVSWLGWMGFLLCIPIILGMSAAYQDYFNRSQGIQERYHSRSKTAKQKVAIIEVAGAIMQSDGFVKRQIDRVREDENVKAIVLRVNSPGGSVSASDYILHHLNELREDRELPLVVSMGGIAASGGYYVAMAVGDEPDSIFAEPTTTTGSIGVIIPHYDVSALMKEFGVKDDSFVSNPRKQILSMTRPASEEDREVIQSYLMQAFNRFKTVVKSGRPKFRDDEAALNQVATGEIFAAEKAEELGLVDEIGFIEAAIDRAVELAGVKGKVRVVEYRRPATLMSSLGLAQATSAPSWVDSMLELSVPKAYYMFSTAPGFRLE